MIRIFLILFACASVTQAQNPLWEMPSFSWQRELGDRPVFEKFVAMGSPGMAPETVTKRGMPVGGFGTGSFMYNICGTFGPFQMKPAVYEERFLSQAAFHIREDFDGDVKSYTLATEDVLPAWNKLKKGDANYKALFPKATFDYKVFNSSISLLHFSPVIRDNYKETSYPVGMFLFKAKNTKEKPVKLSFMFTFPNAPLVKSGDDSPNRSDMFPSRRGLHNVLVKEGDKTVIVMKANEKSNLAETENTSWSIATSGESTYVSTWDGDGNGSDIWNDFTEDGSLSNKDLCEYSTVPSGALCVTVDLQPGEEKVIPFALSWYFPITTFLEGAQWQKMYTKFFPRETYRGDEIVSEGLDNYNQWLASVDEWVAPIVNNKKCPDWLKAGGLNELYYNVFGGSFWENGCLNREQKYGNRKDQHICTVMECVAYAYLETFDVRHHAARVTRDLWPRNERNLLLTYSDIIKESTLGTCTHDLGNPFRNPIIRPDGYVIDYKQSDLLESTPWSEFSPKFILQSYMYWKQYKDDAFLDECWLSIIRSYHYQVATDKDNDGITEMRSSEYIDNKLLNAVLWISSLEALEEMAKYKNDKPLLSEVRVLLKKCKANSEKQFWNESLQYYQYNEKIPFLMADAFAGHRCIDAFGLPSALNEKRTLSHFHKCFDLLVKPLRDYDGDGVGDLGAANILKPDGTPGVKTSEHEHEYEVWTGVTYNLAASMYHWGKKMKDEKLKEKALLTGKGVYFQCWENEENAYWFNSPEAFRFNNMPDCRGNMYQRVRGIWELLQEMIED